jgi:hypothetical protein
MAASAVAKASGAIFMTDAFPGSNPDLTVNGNPYLNRLGTQFGERLIDRFSPSPALGHIQTEHIEAATLETNATRTIERN